LNRKVCFIKPKNGASEPCQLLKNQMQIVDLILPKRVVMLPATKVTRLLERITKEQGKPKCSS